MGKQKKEDPEMEGEDILDFDFSDTHKTHTVEDGEYRLRVLECRKHVKESTESESVFALFEVSDDPYAKEIRLYLSIPNENDSDRVANKKKLRIQEFFEALGVEPRGVPYSAITGYECDAILSTSTDSLYGEQNQISSFVVSA